MVVQTRFMQTQSKQKNNSTYWLPDELWVVVCSFLPFSKKLTMLRVCRRFGHGGCASIVNKSINRKHDHIWFSVRTALLYLESWKTRFPNVSTCLRICHVINRNSSNHFRHILPKIGLFLNRFDFDLPRFRPYERMRQMEVYEKDLLFLKNCTHVSILAHFSLLDISALCNATCVAVRNGVRITNISSLLCVRRLSLVNTLVDSLEPLINLQDMMICSIGKRPHQEPLFFPSTLVHLRKLEIVNSRVHISTEALQACKNLTFLKLYMVECEPVVLADLYNVRELIVCRCHGIIDLVGSFPLLVNLKITHTMIRSIPSMPCLQRLYAEYSRIECFTGSFPSLRNVLFSHSFLLREFCPKDAPLLCQLELYGTIVSRMDGYFPELCIVHLPSSYQTWPTNAEQYQAQFPKLKRAYIGHERVCYKQRESTSVDASASVGASTSTSANASVDCVNEM